MELLYSLPAIVTSTSTALTCISANSATDPGYQLPALQNIWTPSQMVGKGFMMIAAGGYNIGSTTESIAFQFQFDGTIATNGTGSITLATTGLNTVPTSTTGLWQAQCWLNCTLCGTTQATWYVNGDWVAGPGNNESGASASCATYMWGNQTVATGTPSGTTVATNVSYFPELWAKSLGTSGSTITTTQLMIFGLN